MFDRIIHALHKKNEEILNRKIHFLCSDTFLELTNPNFHHFLMFKFNFEIKNMDLIANSSRPIFTLEVSKVVVCGRGFFIIQ